MCSEIEQDPVFIDAENLLKMGTYAYEDVTLHFEKYTHESCPTQVKSSQVTALETNAKNTSQKNISRESLPPKSSEKSSLQKTEG